jgi:hypothetical protein
MFQSLLMKGGVLPMKYIQCILTPSLFLHVVTLQLNLKWIK